MLSSGEECTDACIQLLLDITSRQDDGPGCVDTLGYLRRLFAGSTGDGGAVRTDTKEREQWNRVLVEIKVLKFPDSKDARFTVSNIAMPLLHSMQSQRSTTKRIDFSVASLRLDV